MCKVIAQDFPTFVVKVYCDLFVGAELELHWEDPLVLPLPHHLHLDLLLGCLPEPLATHKGYRQSPLVEVRAESRVREQPLY